MTVDNAPKPGCLGYLISQLRRLLGLQPKAPAKLPYRLRDDFLSPAELSFYKVLISVLGPRATLLAKVRLADILYVARPNENIRFFNRIARRHVDFLLCESSYMRPVLVIELDDASHNQSHRKARDFFLDEALRAADVSIMRVKAKRQYSKDDVTSQLRPFLSGRLHEDDSPSNKAALGDQIGMSVSPVDTPPSCPRCGEPMVVRIASQGRHKGRRFYGCSNYPKCTGMLPFGGERAAG